MPPFKSLSVFCSESRDQDVTNKYMLLLFLWKQGNGTTIFAGKIWNSGFLKVIHRCYIVPQLLKENRLPAVLKEWCIGCGTACPLMHWVDIQAGCGKMTFHHLLSFKRKLICFTEKSLFSCGQGFNRTSLWYALEFLLWILPSLWLRLCTLGTILPLGTLCC